MNRATTEAELQAVGSLLRYLDITTAVLLLTGQITIIGVFVTPGGFRLSVGGPLTGISRLEGKQQRKWASWLIDILDVIIALLLISDQINVSGAFTSSRRFTINVTGPIFGVAKIAAASPDIQSISREFQRIVPRHYTVDQSLLQKLMKD
ncbi:hypothetical protein [Ectobacillus ponti]|uniref:Uncharacterized protein n=1 Tax=Ectobacillus ponti TaxID=2961894 RepID=A0AA41XCS6_9BACI|nr:hypothetical protein [Ectobacillus ponti]MCP8970530.1 hypothetical protein [Ectobacillus ponti]